LFWQHWGGNIVGMGVVITNSTSPLRRWREAQGLGLRAAARMAGCDAGWLSRVETGQRQPRPAQVTRLVRRLGVPVEVVLGSDGES
jgi:transcriptional regulator with XRE-family HTH domain